MKKLIIVIIVLFGAITLSGCDTFTNKLDENDITVDDIKDAVDDTLDKGLECNGESNFVIIDEVCYPINDMLSKSIQIQGTSTTVEYANGIDLMTDYVADLSDSTGIAVVPADVFAANTDPQTIRRNANGEIDDSEENTENILVKLTEDGFFEKVSFTDEFGSDVNIVANPLALEVYGPFTIVIFEVETNNEWDNNQETNFADKVYSSLYAGGIYLIHNETGKMYATKDIVLNEETYTYEEDHSRNVTLQVTLNEPVVETIQELILDENGYPVLDENGKEVYEELQVALEDENGDPIIFTEGPIKTEFIQVAIMNSEEQQQLDDEGNPVLDEDGNPVLIKVEVPALDPDGNQMYYEELVAVLDENGDPVFEDTFQVEMYINDIEVITVTTYYSNVTENALSSLAQKFIDNVLQDYYNWNYYRVNNHQLQYNGFVYDDESIFYREDKQDDTQIESFIKKLSFDTDTSDLIIEDYLNATKAGFDQCEISFDDNAEVFICHMYDENIKIYSETNNLVTIPDSKDLSLISMPNGELFFYNYQPEYNEELGYETTILYTINSDGTLDESYVELGKTPYLSNGDYSTSSRVQMLDGLDYPYDNNNYYLQVNIPKGGKIIDSMDLSLESVGEFSSTESICLKEEGCYQTVSIEIFNPDGVSVTTFENGIFIHLDESFSNYYEAYTYDEDTEFFYIQDTVNEIKTCVNELGCPNRVSLSMENEGQNGLWLSKNYLIEPGDQFVNQLRVQDDALITYEYSAVIEGPVCDYDETCYYSFPVFVYNLDGELNSEGYGYDYFEKGDVMPFAVEYYITEDTTIVYSTYTVGNEQGESNSYYIGEEYNISINYEFGEIMYNSIEFAETDIVYVTEETRVAELCTVLDGCYQNDVTFKVVNDNEDVLYEYKTSINVDYGYKQAYITTININDIDVYYDYSSTQNDKVCDQETCYNNVEFTVANGNSFDTLGYKELAFTEGEAILSRVVLTTESLTLTEDQLICKKEDGCYKLTNNFLVYDEDGNLIDTESEYHQQELSVQFKNGDYMPTTENFQVTLTASNIEYNYARANIYDFLNEFHKAVQLDENTYFIEKSSWSEGENNYILSYNEETNRYKLTYTNLNSMEEITKFNDSFIAVNDSKTGIYKLTLVERYSTEDFSYYDETNLTDGLLINEIENLIVDYDGSIYFEGIDNQIQEITGFISEDGLVTIDTTVTEREIIRIRPIN
jgi:hypothetical protein